VARSLVGPTVLFESWRGRYSDSPRVISEKLGERCPELRRSWVHAGDRSLFPEDVRTVRRHKLRYFAELAAARILVANDVVTRQVVKSPRLTYVQTWHGTPLKLLGLDERNHSYAGAQEHLDRMRRDVSHWDHLVSPSPACTTIFRGAFGYEGEVWETGYPRNDLLSSPDAGSVRRRVRTRLGLADHQLAVLWAPTWRDDALGAEAGLPASVRIDERQLLAAAPPETVLVKRMHKNVTGGPGDSDDPRVVDGGAVDDITELFLAADVLVSDYSSAIVDFAVTGKPMVLFAPDLERYRDEVRGMYFDYEQWVPGPVTSTTEELAGALTELGQVRSAHADRYAEFRRVYCPFEDGHAGDRVVQLMLEASGLA
jgi:CDP-glycerol glycerophosphotransferase